MAVFSGWSDLSVNFDIGGDSDMLTSYFTGVAVAQEVEPVEVLY